MDNARRIIGIIDEINKNSVEIAGEKIIKFKASLNK
jgi:hypothetical protein